MTLAATLTLAEAARRTWGAVVVGAGPAGGAAARELARRSVAVLLVDRAAFPRWKVCGCCLNGRATAVLEAIGLGALPARCRAVPLERIRLAAGGRAADVALSGGMALSREAFDAALIEAAVTAGAAFLPETRAMFSQIHPHRGILNGARLLLQQGEQRSEISAQVVIAADGLGGPLLARAGEAAPVEAGARIGAGATTTDAPDFYRPGVVYMACGAGGYTGMVRLEDGRLDLAAAFDAAHLRTAGGPARAAARMVREAGWPPPGPVEELPLARHAGPDAAAAPRRGGAAVRRRRRRRVRRALHRRGHGLRAGVGRGRGAAGRPRRRAMAAGTGPALGRRPPPRRRSPSGRLPRCGRGVAAAVADAGCRGPAGAGAGAGRAHNP